MFIFFPLLCQLTILIKYKLFHIVDGHEGHIRSHELNVPGHPFHGVEFLQDAVAVASDDFDDVVALLVDELLEEHPNVV